MTYYSDPPGAGNYGPLDTTTPSGTWLYGSFGSPSIYAVNQGGVGDCWFVSSLMCMATFGPDYLESMITSNGSGVYTVRLYLNGALTPVTIGDDLPSGANSGNGYGNWASLIEKAYAALQGSYTAMNGNFADTAFRSLMNQSCTDFYIGGGNTGAVAAQIKAAVSQGQGVEIYSSDLFIPQAQSANDGLSGSFPEIDYNSSTGNCEGLVVGFAEGAHAYAVVGYDATTGNFIVCNPWDRAVSVAYSNNGVTYANAYASLWYEQTGALKATTSGGSVTPGYYVKYFSEFEISPSDLQYFYGGAYSNAPLHIAHAPVVRANDISRSGEVTGAYNFIDLFNLEAGYSDLINAFGTNAQAMQSWFASREPIEHRPDIFDGLDYIASYGDLINYFKSAGSEHSVLDDGALHFIAYGFNEGRTTTFNGLDYIASQPDLIKAFGVNGDAGAYHYIENGAGEGRTTTFDGLDYIASYNDLIKAFGANEQAGAAHFISYGSAEGRAATLFDGLDYIAGYTDLMTAFGANNDAGAAHFISNGYNEGRNASPFDVAAYESAHTDLIGKYATPDAFLAAYINTYVSTGHFLT